MRYARSIAICVVALAICSPQLLLADVFPAPSPSAQTPRDPQRSGNNPAWPDLAGEIGDRDFETKALDSAGICEPSVDMAESVLRLSLRGSQYVHALPEPSRHLPDRATPYLGRAPPAWRFIADFSQSV